MSQDLASTSHFWFLFLETRNEDGKPTAIMTVKGLSPNFDLCLEKATELKAKNPGLFVGLYQERKRGFFPPAPPVEEMDVIIMGPDGNDIYTVIQPDSPSEPPF